MKFETIHEKNLELVWGNIESEARSMQGIWSYNQIRRDTSTYLMIINGRLK